MSTDKQTSPPDGQELFKPLSAEAARMLEGYEAVLGRAAPLKPAHLRELPKNIRALSGKLTSRRLDLGGDYLRSPGNMAAYIRYFLPWNLYRLARLIPGLPSSVLDPPEGGSILDIGAGPLTMAQALWLSRPDLRTRRLQFVCLDRGKKIMGTGLELFKGLAGKDCPWRFRLVQANLDGAARLKTSFSLVCAFNVLNELEWARRVPLARQLGRRLSGMLAGLDSRRGRVLLIEPGTRFGGRLVSLGREELMAKGCGVAAPCTHENPCPMLGRESSSWCHFVFSSESAPGWLVRLSRQAGLPKTSAALSFVLAGRGLEKTARSGESARIVSEPFKIESSGVGTPGRSDYGSYGCSPKGLVLLAHGRKDGAGFESGREIDLSSWRKIGKDGKSGGALLAPKPGF